MTIGDITIEEQPDARPTHRWYWSVALEDDGADIPSWHCGTERTEAAAIRKSNGCRRDVLSGVYFAALKNKP